MEEGVDATVVDLKGVKLLETEITLEVFGSAPTIC